MRIPIPNAARRRLLAAAALAPFAASGADDRESDAALKRILQRAQARPATSLSAADQAARMRERIVLLAAGEAALARNDPAAALAAFEQAAGILHAADAEMGLVRTYMQAGEYRRALAFVAHTASAHREVPGGAALYAWLLHVGGQHAAARRLLDAAAERFHDDPLLRRASAQLSSPAPLARGPLLAPPARLAPFDTPVVLPAHARVLASGVLCADGQRAIVPIAATGSRTIWVRNGVGNISAASVSERHAALGLAVLTLATPWAAGGERLRLAPRDPFPGSVAFAVYYVAGSSAEPRWPLLAAGFTGRAVADGARALGVSVAPGLRGGPLFDNAGRLAAIAAGGSDELTWTPSALRAALGPRWADSAVESVPALSADEVYERALFSTINVVSA